MTTIINVCGHPLESSECWKLYQRFGRGIKFVDNPTGYRKGTSLNEQLAGAVREIRPVVQAGDVIVAPSIRNADRCLASLYPQAIIVSIKELIPVKEQTYA